MAYFPFVLVNYSGRCAKESASEPFKFLFLKGFFFLEYPSVFRNQSCSSYIDLYEISDTEEVEVKAANELFLEKLSDCVTSIHEK